MFPPDNFEKHIKDTLEAGSYLNDRIAVEITSKESPDRIKDLIELGVRFDKKKQVFMISLEKEVIVNQEYSILKIKRVMKLKEFYQIKY